MSWLPDAEPKCAEATDAEQAVEMIIEPKARDLGDFEVRRVLPAAKRQMVGPFIFFDHMGPADFKIGHGIDVRPHPHIGLATVTYLYQGSILHRDSLGYQQLITPGAVNWMTAGKGIVHSERSSDEARTHNQHLEGLQLWVALPLEAEETEPAFVHHSADSIPQINLDGAKVRVIAGTAYGVTSPVNTLSELFYLDVALAQDSCFKLQVNYSERAIYIVRGTVTIDGEDYAAGRMLVLAPNCDLVLNAKNPAQLVVVGGEPLEGPRYVWWNFVSSSRERIERAKADWRENRFGQVPGETEFIPLPEK